LHYLTNEVDRAVGCGMDKSKCGFLIFITYELSCACTIAKKIKNNTPNRLDEIHTHWNRLQFKYEGGPKDRNTNISLIPKLDFLQVFFFFFKCVWLNLCFLHFVPVLWHFKLYNLKCKYMLQIIYFETLVFKPHANVLSLHEGRTFCAFWIIVFELGLTCSDYITGYIP